MLLAQFSTKLNKFFNKFWAYLGTKSNLIHTKKKILLKMMKMLSTSKKQSSTNFKKQKIEISQKKRF